MMSKFMLKDNELAKLTSFLTDVLNGTMGYMIIIFKTLYYVHNLHLPR